MTSSWSWKISHGQKRFHAVSNLHGLCVNSDCNRQRPYKNVWRGYSMGFCAHWRYPNQQHINMAVSLPTHDDVIKWKHFPRYWPFVRGIHRSPVNSLHKGQWRGALMFSLICVWINGWVNNREAGDLRRFRANYDVTIMTNHVLIRSVISYRSYLYKGFAMLHVCHKAVRWAFMWFVLQMCWHWIGAWRKG